MKKTAPPFTFSVSGQTLPDAVDSARLPILVDNWLLAGDINRHSERTIETRRERLSRLLWYFDHYPAVSCGLSELRQFIRYLNRPD